MQLWRLANVHVEFRFVALGKASANAGSCTVRAHVCRRETGKEEPGVWEGRGKDGGWAEKTGDVNRGSRLRPWERSRPQANWTSPPQTQIPSCPPAPCHLRPPLPRQLISSISRPPAAENQLAMPDTVTLTPRVVPGAPPPVAPSKSHKKKRKAGKPKEESDGGSHVAVPDSAAAALIDKAPEEGDVKEGIVAPQLVAQPSLPSEGLQTPLLDVKPSPVVEMLNKRLKANGKKIVSVVV